MNGLALAAGAELLRRHGVPDPIREARRLYRWAFGTGGGEVCYQAALRQRMQRMPFSHITGIRPFWRHDFEVTPSVLDPRPDSEILVTAVVDCMRRSEGADARLRVLDLGTGSGCLLLSVLAEFPQMVGLGIDISGAALAVARRNAVRTGTTDRCRFEQGDWADGIEGRFDLVLSNPPYVARGEIDRLAPEIARWEPQTALDGGPDGLDAYRRLAPALAGLLVPGGVVWLEIGAGQETSIRPLLEGEGLVIRRTWRDLDGRPRCLEALAA